uniref:Uncharacterized protein n=1 Tax=Ignisphaera aggregans TaxID=334771 RepID=A0A7C5TIR2_9CREN
MNESIFILSGPLSTITTYNPDITTLPTAPTICRVAYRDLTQEFAETYFIRISLSKYIKAGAGYQVGKLIDYLVEKYNVSYMLVNSAQYKKLGSLKLIEESVIIIRHRGNDYYLVKISKRT